MHATIILCITSWRSIRQGSASAAVVNDRYYNDFTVISLLIHVVIDELAVNYVQLVTMHDTIAVVSLATCSYKIHACTDRHASKNEYSRRYHHIITSDEQ